MPYDFMVDWRDYFLWVDQADIPHIAERVADFHNEISPSEFVDRQIACRELWLNWLSADGFFRHLHRHLKPIRYEACSDADESPLAVSA